MEYEIIETESGLGLIGTDAEGKTYSIPFDETNSDYQAYLASLGVTE